jgi:hypothetical protein
MKAQTTVYLPECETVEQACQWAAERHLVALCYVGPTGLIRGLAVEPEAAAAALHARAVRLRAAAEALL